MNLDSARNRVKIIEGLSARILRCFDSGAADGAGLGAVLNDAETIQRQCKALAADLKETTEKETK
jgi:hypothetical protein